MLIFPGARKKNLVDVIDIVDMALLQDSNGHVVIQAPAPVLGNSAAAVVTTTAATPPPENTNNIFLYESSGNMYLPQVGVMTSMHELFVHFFSWSFVKKKAVDDWSGSQYDYAAQTHNWALSPAVVAERTTRELTELLPINSLPTALQIAAVAEAAEAEGQYPPPHSEDLLKKVIADSLGPSGGGSLNSAGTPGTIKAENLNGYSEGGYSPEPMMADYSYDPNFQQTWCSNPPLTPTTPTSHNTFEDYHLNSYNRYVIVIH